MITQEDENIIKKLIIYLDTQALVPGKMEVDWEKIHWSETLEKMIYNLKIAKESYRPCSNEDLGDRFFTAECECGWWGSSKLLRGGVAIADTGDYSDCTCPVCDSADISEKID